MVSYLMATLYVLGAAIPTVAAPLEVTGEAQIREGRPNERFAPAATAVAGKGASLIAVSYAKQADGYVPSFTMWHIGPHGSKTAEAGYQPTMAPRKYPEYPFLGACRCGNADIAMLLWPGQNELIRLDTRGNLVYTRTARTIRADQEVFTAIAADRENGLWLGTKVGMTPYLYHLDERGDVMLERRLPLDQEQESVILRIAQPPDSDELLVCGVSRHSGGRNSLWVMRLDAAGEVLSTVTVPTEPPAIGETRLVALPGGRAALGLLSSRGESFSLYFMDRDLQPVGNAPAIDPPENCVRAEMIGVGTDLAIVLQARRSTLLLLDEQGRLKSRQPLVMVGRPVLPLAAVGSQVLVAGLPGSPDTGDIATSVSVRSFAVPQPVQAAPAVDVPARPATQPSR